MHQVDWLFETIRAAEFRHAQGVQLPQCTVYSLLQVCIERKHLAAGRQVHSLMVSSGLHSVALLRDHLIRLFALHGTLLEANVAFCTTTNPGVHTCLAVMSAHSLRGENDGALELYHKMLLEGLTPNKALFIWGLKACGNSGVIEQGKLIHDQIVSSRFRFDVIFGGALIDMYVKCGSLKEAHRVFDQLQDRNVVCWCTMIAGHAQHGHSLSALELYVKMRHAGVKPDNFVFPSVLKACGRIRASGQGELLHEEVIRSGFESEMVIGSALVDMYAKCGNLEAAHIVFNKLPKKNIVTWGAMITGYIQHGHNFAALELFKKMELEGIKPNRVTLLCILKLCGSVGDLQQGKLIHGQIMRGGLELDVAAGNALIDMYAKCGSLKEAHKVFGNLRDRDEVSWGIMIAGCVQHGQGYLILELLEKMQHEVVKVTIFIFTCILKACSSLGALKLGNLIYDQIIKNELEADVVIGNGIIDMYAKCGDLGKAQKVFAHLQNKNVVSWDVMIGGFAQKGQSLPAFHLFQKMLHRGIKPNKATYLHIMKACGEIGDFGMGQHVHGQVIASGVEIDVFLGSSLMDMYAKCGSLEEACKVFDIVPSHNVITWSALIGGYAHHGQGLRALELFNKMQEKGIKPDTVSFLCALKASVSTGVTEWCEILHEQAVRSGIESDVEIGNALIDTYAKCGSLEASLEVFENLPHRDVVSWNAMITGYSLHGVILSAFELFEIMQQEDIKPDKVTLLCMLKASGNIGAACQVRVIHDQITHRELDSVVAIGNMLVDAYANCGSLREACKVFDDMSERDLMSWGAMTAAYAENGNPDKAWQCFEYMQQQGLKPDCMMYTRILSACSCAGYIEDGCQYFRRMKEDHGIMPTIEHFNCMVELLGHSGCLKEAKQLLQTMPIQPDILGWMSLLTACRNHGNVKLGSQCFNHIVHLDPNFASGFVVMADIYADAHQWEHAYKIQALRSWTRTWKKPGVACMEITTNMHDFTVGDKTHPQYGRIYANLKRLKDLLNKHGYVPQLDLVMESISQKIKEDVF